MNVQQPMQARLVMLTHRVLPIALIIGLCGLLIALYRQHVSGDLPCALCILQRYALVVTLLTGGCVFILGLYQTSARFNARLLVSLLMALAALTGAGIAAKQWWSIQFPAFTCGADKIQDWVNARWLAEQWPAVFKAQGSCADAVAPLWGISLPMWSWVMFSILLIAALVQLFRYQRRT